MYARRARRTAARLAVPPGFARSWPGAGPVSAALPVRSHARGRRTHRSEPSSARARRGRRRTHAWPGRDRPHRAGSSGGRRAPVTATRSAARYVAGRAQVPRPAEPGKRGDRGVDPACVARLEHPPDPQRDVADSLHDSTTSSAAPMPPRRAGFSLDHRARPRRSRASATMRAGLSRLLVETDRRGQPRRQS